MNWEVVWGMILGLLGVVGMVVIPIAGLAALGFGLGWFEKHVPGGEVTFWIVLFASLILGAGLVAA